METVGTPVAWIGFSLVVLVMLAIDLGVVNRKAHEIRFREAAIWTTVWITLAMAFNAGVYFWLGRTAALEFLTGYVIEKSLSVDNIFVFAVIFGTFRVEPRYQHRVLFWGILGALALRGVFIAAGAALIQRFHVVMYVFGAFLVVTAVRLLRHSASEVHPERNILVRLFRRVMPVAHDVTDGRFTVMRDGRRFATPLLVVLVAVEASDVLFAIDSIPAIFAITEDPFIVYTSNIFAILGLRSLYFLLAGMIQRFYYLNIGLALVLGFVGLKMLIADFVKIPIAVSLGVIAVFLAGAIIASLLRSRRERTVSAPIVTSPS